MVIQYIYIAVIFLTLVKILIFIAYDHSIELGHETTVNIITISIFLLDIYLTYIGVLPGMWSWITIELLKKYRNLVKKSKEKRKDVSPSSPLIFFVLIN